MNLKYKHFFSLFTTRKLLLDSKDSKTFKKLVQDIFSLKEDINRITLNNQQPSIIGVLEKVIVEKATNEFKLFPNKNWLEKCIQIHTLSNNFKSW